jgi:hypothetical protein
MEGYTLWTSHGEEVVTGDGKRGDDDDGQADMPEAYSVDHEEP